MISLKLKSKLYARLYKWSSRKYRDVHLSRFYNDIKCTNCNEWFSVSGIEHKHSYVTPHPDFGYTTQCGKCNAVSHWNCVAFPFPARCNSEGTPFTDK